MKYARSLAILSIIVVTLLSYANNLHNDFVWDDEFLIEKNSFLTNFSNLPKMLTSNSTAGFGGTDNFYRPTQNIFYLMIYQAFGKSTVAFHLGNIFLHLINSILIFILSLRLWGRVRVAWIASLLWACHPVHTEAITYISGTADPMSVLFFLAAALCLPLPDSQQRISRHAMSLGLLSLSLMSKEAMVVGPSLFILIYFLKATQPWKWKTYLPLLPSWFLVAGYLWIRQTILNFDRTYQFYKTSNIYTENLLYRIYTFTSTLPEYLKMLIWPVDLHMERDFPISTSWNQLPVLVGLLLVLTLGGFAVYRLYKRQDRKPAFLLLWFFASFIPMSGIVIPVNSFILEHWLYLSSISFFIAVAHLVVKLTDWQKWLGHLVLFLVTTFLIYSTQARNRDWKTPISFYSNILKYSRGTARVHNNLAMAYSDKKKWDLAAKHYHIAIELSDTYPQTHYNLARVYVQMGQYQKALNHLERSLKIDPNFSYATKLRLKIQSHLSR